MLRAVETAPTHSEVMTAGLLIINYPHELLLLLPPYQRPDAMTRMRLSATLYTDA